MSAPAWNHPVAYRKWGREEYDAIERVIKSDRFTMGAEVEAFEGEFAAWHGMKHGIMTNSGSSANLVGVCALEGIIAARHGTGFGLVAVPAIAWATTYAPFAQRGVTQVAVEDVDGTWNAPGNPDLKADVLVRCSVLGNPAHDKFVVRSNYVFEDNCESLGARYLSGRLCGTTGIVNTFSFFWSHQISAIEGGMVLTNDDHVARLCRLFRNHGNAGFVDGKTALDEQYDFKLFGFNLRPVEMHAAIAREQLKKLPSFIAARQRNWDHFRALVKDLVELPQSNGEGSPFGLQFVCSTPSQRRTLAARLRAEGIDCRPPTGGSFLRHDYGDPWRQQKTPRADRLHSCALFLGNAPWPIEPEVEKAANIIKEVCR